MTTTRRRATAGGLAGALLAVVGVVFISRPPCDTNPRNPHCVPPSSSPSATLVTPSPTSTSSPSATPEPTVAPSPTAAPTGGAYGTLAADSKANLEIGPWGDIAHRWIADTTSTPVSVRWSQRYGPGGYSGGSGGAIVVSIVPDAAGKPGTAPIAITQAYAQGNPGAQTKYDLQTFATAGQQSIENRAYWTVWHNADPSPTANWISVNDVWSNYSPLPTNPERPDHAVWQGGPSGWRLADDGYSPVMDVTFADGTHQGVGFIEAMVAQYRNVGGSAMVRERFSPPTVLGPFTQIAVRARRVAGSAPLTMTLGVDGKAVATGSATVPLAPTGDSIHWATGWAIATVPSFTLPAGGSAVFLVTAPAGTSYELVPLRQGTTWSLQSRSFTEGEADFTVDGGATWLAPYPDRTFAPTDWQWFVK